MEISIPTLLALFTLLTLSSVTYFIAKKIKIPYTVLLVAVGLFLVPLSELSAFSFLKDFTLTPSLLFYVFLPILIFESAYNMNIRKLQQNVASISLLAVIGLLISTFFVAGSLYFIFDLIGFHVPFIVTLLFGALISSTDPVAVLALFKEYGAPKRLTMIFEGESLFNDGTAVAVFLILLQIAMVGYSGVGSIVEGIMLFSSMVVGGVVFGLLMGAIFSKLIGAMKSNESVSIVLMIVMAHLTFILSELISHHLEIFGQDIMISAIIATSIASMMIGNYGRFKISPRADEFIERFFSTSAFIANSIVFILIGLLFSTLPFSVLSFLLPIILAVAVVAIGRALSIYPVISFLNKLKIEEHIPASWQHLLAWGSLRGALAITLVLLIPADWIPESWIYTFTPRDLILALTIGCIYFTLFMKATTIGTMIKKLNIDDLNEVEEIEYKEGMAMITTRILTRLEEHFSKGYIHSESYLSLKNHYLSSNKLISDDIQKSPLSSEQMSEVVLRIYAIGIQKHYVRDLFIYNEISEDVMRRIMAKLSTQLSYLEQSNIDFDTSISTNEKDWFEKVMSLSDYVFSDKKSAIEELYMYYRAKKIICRKVIKEFQLLRDACKTHFFDEKIFQKVIVLYERFRTESREKMQAIYAEHKDIIEPLSKHLATRGIARIQESMLEDLYKKEMLTSKLYISLQEKFEEEQHQLEKTI